MFQSCFESHRARCFMPLLMALLCVLTIGGCIRSRVKITSEPTGAEVIWRGRPYGPTPITIPIMWYWYYDFTLEKPGYRPLEVVERFRTPPWFLMPLDLPMEILPIPIPDTRNRHYVLQPAETSDLITQPGEERVLTPEQLKALGSGEKIDTQ